MLIKSYGVVKYDPSRGKLKSEKAKNTIIIEIEDGEDLAAYYRYFFLKEFGIELLKPNYDIHMTITKVHEPNDEPWGFLSEKRVEILRTQDLFWNKDHLWVNAFSEDWELIRKHYGLEKHKNGHITIGKFKECDKFLIKEKFNEDCF